MAPEQVVVSIVSREMNANLRGGQAAAAGGSGFDVYSSPSSSFAAAERLRDLAGSSSTLTVLLDQSRSFQITISSLLGLIAAIQLGLLILLVVYRSKHVLEFAQPTFICIFVFMGMISTWACSLFIFTSEVGCLIRGDPVIYSTLTVMAATIIGSVWRMLVLLSNPLASAQSGGNLSHMERARQTVLRGLSSLAGCFDNLARIPSRRSPSGLRVQITQAQLARVVCILSAPQIAFQIASMAVPSLRSHRNEFIYFNIEGSSIGGVECGRESPAAMIVSVALLSITYFLAYLLNRRNKKELKHLPQIVDEREAIECITCTLIRALVIAAPMTAMA